MARRPLSVLLYSSPDWAVEERGSKLPWKEGSAWPKIEIGAPIILGSCLRRLAKAWISAWTWGRGKEESNRKRTSSMRKQAMGIRRRRTVLNSLEVEGPTRTSSGSGSGWFARTPPSDVE